MEERSALEVNNIEQARDYIAGKGNPDNAAEALVRAVIEQSQEHSRSLGLLGGASIALSALHEFLDHFEKEDKKSPQDAIFGNHLIKKLEQYRAEILGNNNEDAESREIFDNFKDKIAKATGADFKLKDNHQDDHNRVDHDDKKKYTGQSFF